MALQGLRGGDGEGFAAQDPGAVALVVLPEDRPGGALGVVGQEEPVAVAARQVDRRVAPALGRFRRGGLAGFHIGVVGRGQAQVRQALLAALQHTVEGGEIVAVLDSVLRALEDLLHRVVRQRLQPELLDLLQLLRVRVGCVVLVVVVEAEQGEDLVDRLDVGLRGGLPGSVSPPRRCR